MKLPHPDALEPQMAVLLTLFAMIAPPVTVTVLLPLIWTVQLRFGLRATMPRPMPADTWRLRATASRQTVLVPPPQTTAKIAGCWVQVLT